MTRHHDWSKVAKISTGCYSGRSVTYNFVVVLTDGTKIDLVEESPRDFVAVYPRVAEFRFSNFEFRV
jgi:hypothetical protein